MAEPPEKNKVFDKKNEKESITATGFSQGAGKG
jgi:hypothetical protein